MDRLRTNGEAILARLGIPISERPAEVVDSAPVEVHRSSSTEQPHRSKRPRFHGDICQEIADHGTEVTCATSAKTSRVLDERGVRGACPPRSGRRLNPATIDISELIHYSSSEEEPQWLSVVSSV